MKPLNGFVMMKKRETKTNGIILSEAAQAELLDTGFEVLDIAPDVESVAIGDVVYPGYAEEARAFNGFIFCKAIHLVAKA
jgi:hypothetical protein